jgi:hypothetical protein
MTTACVHLQCTQTPGTVHVQTQRGALLVDEFGWPAAGRGFTVGCAWAGCLVFALCTMTGT